MNPVFVDTNFTSLATNINSSTTTFILRQAAFIYRSPTFLDGSRSIFVFPSAVRLP
jgi:hypothetical protein